MLWNDWTSHDHLLLSTRQSFCYQWILEVHVQVFHPRFPSAWRCSAANCHAETCHSKIRVIGFSWTGTGHRLQLHAGSSSAPRSSRIFKVQISDNLERRSGGFHEWGYPQIIHFNGIFPYKPSIMESPIYGIPHVIYIYIFIYIYIYVYIYIYICHLTSLDQTRSFNVRICIWRLILCQAAMIHKLNQFTKHLPGDSGREVAGQCSSLLWGHWLLANVGQNIGQLRC